MSWRWRQRLIWLATFGWIAAAVGDLSFDGPALAAPTDVRAAVQSTWPQPDCVPNFLRGCPRYDDAVPR